ncbi:MAG: OPT/YSL family transporter, partial [Erysipelotrichales bacterium]
MDKKLPHGAYGGVSGKDYVPYVTDKENKGGNLAVFIIGLFLAALFAASTTYSGLKAGLTVAAGIPSAIIGGALVTAFAKKKGILGSNIVQGMGSAGESVASGVIFVMPAIFIIGGTVGYVEAVVAGIAGVLIGIGVASLVHNYLLIEEHGKLMYPESMAISETLVASEAGGESLKFMGIGFVVGGIITTLTSSVLGLWKETMTFVGDAAYKWRFELEVNPLLLGIGFIVGLEVSMLMFAGSILANFAVTPLIGYFAEMAPSSVTIWNESSMAINAAGAAELSGSYTKYIGAGMMLAGGLLGAIKLIPVIINSIKQTIGAKSGGSEEKSLQGIILIGGLIIAAAASVLISGGNVTMMIVGFIITFILMFLFIIVAGRLTGTIGTSNLPVSGMVIASLVVMTLIFVVFGWKNPEANKSLLMFATLLVTSIAIAGGYMQSQKVTYIVGGNKNEMQKYFAIAGILGGLIVVLAAGKNKAGFSFLGSSLAVV